MNKIEAVLHPDPQTVPPAGLCPRCGGVVYPPRGCCGRCRRERP